MFQDAGEASVKIAVAWIGIIGAVLAAIVAFVNSLITGKQPSQPNAIYKSINMSWKH